MDSIIEKNKVCYLTNILEGYYRVTMDKTKKKIL